MADVYPRRNLGIDAEPWGREVQTRQEALARAVSSQEAELSAVSRTFASSLRDLANQIASLPITIPATSTTQPTSANTSTWTTKAEAVIVIPAGKTSASLMMVGNIALLDTVTGGIAAPPSARFLVNGSLVLPITNGVPAAKDSGASQVNNVISLASSARLTGLTPGGTISVALQVAVFHSTAYATASSSNFATVSAQATFTL